MNFRNRIGCHRSYRRGWLFADLLVGLAILATFVALVMPAILKSREHSRSQACGRKLTQIALKSQIYEIAQERLPCQLGASGAVQYYLDWTNSGSIHYWQTKQMTSPLGLIAEMDGTLPYPMDPALFDFDLYVLPDSPFWDYENWQLVSGTHMPAFVCPSEVDNYSPYDARYGMQPAYVNDVETEDALGFLFDPSAHNYKFTSYLGVLGASTGGAQRAPSDLWAYRGMITSRETVTSKDVSGSDGLSNTFMFGESLGKIVNGELLERNAWFSGGITRGRGLTDWMTQGDRDNRLIGNRMHSSSTGFSSTHRDGVRFARGDASVQTISRDIDWQTYYALCGAFDTD